MTRDNDYKTGDPLWYWSNRSEEAIPVVFVGNKSGSNSWVYICKIGHKMKWEVPLQLLSRRENDK